MELNNSKENCIILFHISTGDNFTMYALVLHYQKIYKNVYIFCLFRNKLSVNQLYEKFSNIHIILIENPNYNYCTVPNNLVEDLQKKLINYDMFLSGKNIPGWECPLNFWNSFYKDSKLDYSIRYNEEYCKINRNNKNEIELYNKLILKYSTKYIFVHDHRNIKYIHPDGRINVIIQDKQYPIFHPNINYYNDINNKYYNLWNIQFLSDNLLDYCYIIENAEEIYINDSCFSCLCPYLDLSKVKSKNIYTNLDLINYHKSFKDWNIINY